MKKRLYFLAPLPLLAVLPTALAASCGSSDSTTPVTPATPTSLTTQKAHTLLTIGKTSDEMYDVVNDASGKPALKAKYLILQEQLDNLKAADFLTTDEYNTRRTQLTGQVATAKQVFDMARLWIDINPGDAKWWYAQAASAFQTGLYDTEQAVNPGDPDWLITKPFAKFVRQLGKQTLETATNAAAIKAWADKYIVLLTRVQAGTQAAYIDQLNTLVQEFASLGSAPADFYLGVTVAMKAIRWNNNLGEMSEINLLRLLRPLGITSLNDFSALRTTRIIPVTTPVSLGRKSDGTNLVMNVSSTRPTSATLAAGIYMGDLTVSASTQSAPVANAAFTIESMPANGPAVAGDTVVKITGAEFTSAGVSYVYWGSNGATDTEYRFVSVAALNAAPSLQAQTTLAAKAAAYAALSGDARNALGLEVGSFFLAPTQVSAAIATATPAAAGAAFWSSRTSAFTMVLPSVTVTAADGTKTNVIYTYNLVNNLVTSDELKMAVDAVKTYIRS